MIPDRFSCMLALRFLRTHASASLSFMIKICCISIALGTGALTLIAAIMTGLEKATHTKLQTIHADLTISAPDQQPLDHAKITDLFSTELKHTVAAVSSASYAELLAKHSQTGATQPAVIKGIDPTQEAQVSTIASLLQDSKTPWPLLFTNDTIIMGTTLAEHLGLRIGDTLTLLVPDPENTSTKVTLSSTPVTLAGLFKTGIYEFDERIIYCSRELFSQLFHEGITHISIKLTPQAQAHEQQTLTLLKQRLNGLTVSSWKELYPAIVAALTLEKYVMLFVFTLVTLIASMNIIALLSLYITHKQKEIAILKAMGMPNNTINTIFILLGMGITFCATLVGVIGAAFASYILTKYPFITLPDVYYVTHLPADLNIAVILCVIGVSLLLSFITCLFAVRTTHSIAPAVLLKHAGAI
jgi:lipoprotein-releasing system permease protein